MKIRPIGTNMTVLEVGTDEIFFSYEMPVAAWIKGKCYKTSYKHSSTTGRHINKFLDGRRAVEMSQQFFDDLIKDEDGMFD